MSESFTHWSVIVVTFPRPETWSWTKRTVIGCLTSCHTFQTFSHQFEGMATRDYKWVNSCFYLYSNVWQHACGTHYGLNVTEAILIQPSSPFLHWYREDKRQFHLAFSDSKLLSLRLAHVCICFMEGVSHFSHTHIHNYTNGLNNAGIYL